MSKAISILKSLIMISTSSVSGEREGLGSVDATESRNRIKMPVAVKFLKHTSSPRTLKLNSSSHS